MDRAQVISELASSGSIDALLKSHPELSRKKVTRILNGVALLVAQEDEAPRPTSPLYCAYNGYMLGLFKAAAFLAGIHKKQRRRKDAVERIGDFLLEFASQTGKSLDLGKIGHIDALEDQLRPLELQVGRLLSPRPGDFPTRRWSRSPGGG